MASKRLGILVILDGFGVAEDGPYNAVSQAKTPTLDRLKSDFPYGELNASEQFVGLPEGFMGNSEVGHLNIGAGRVVYQDFSLISQAIEDGSFFDNEAIQKIFSSLKDKRHGTLHLMGLLSDGGVHSHESHLYALLDFAKKEGVERVVIHPFLDGRDTDPTSGVGHVQKLQEFLATSGLGKIGAVMGRFYAMDRDKRWERTQAAYDAIVAGEGKSFKDPVQFVRDSYEAEVTDEFVEPGIASGYRGVRDGDAILFFNFRADRARQLTRSLHRTDFPHFRRKDFPTLAGFVTFTPYDEEFELDVAFPKSKVPKTLGQVVSELGWHQLRIAETEKYAHVTYFFNGGEEQIFEGERRVLVPSPREVRTYDEKPEMSAFEVTEKLLAELQKGDLQFVVVNYANCDMVGHTGNLGAAIKAVETVDKCLGKVIDFVEQQGAFALITADHGNCEVMLNRQGTPLTSHTTLPVPLYLVDAGRSSKWSVRDGGKLCDIAPTLLKLWAIDPPKEMTGTSLIGAQS